MKKFDVTKEQMASAVNENGKEPWTVLGMKRTAWFSALKRNEVTMEELRSTDVSSDGSDVSSDGSDVSTDVSSDGSDVSTDVSSDGSDVSTDVSTHSTDVSTDVPVRKVSHWNPEVIREANAVGRGGVRYRFSDVEKYNEFRKEDAFRIMERSVKNEITHKPVERIVKPDNIPEELLQYDQTDIPYEVWKKYIDESKGEHWGTFVMKYGRFLEPKKHNAKEEVEKRVSEKLGLEYFERYIGKGGKYNPTRDSYIWNGEECFF